MTNKHHNLYPFNQALFNERLSCVVYKLSYNFQTKLGILTMATSSNCDMTACILLFKDIDKNVRQVQTFSGKVPSTVYMLTTSGAWRAFKPHQLTQDQLNPACKNNL